MTPKWHDIIATVSSALAFAIATVKTIELIIHGNDFVTVMGWGGSALWSCLYCLTIIQARQSSAARSKTNGK